MAILFTLLVCLSIDAYPVEDVMLISRVVQKEALNQSEMVQRLVADVILNRVESPNFPNTVQEVINQPGQFHIDKNQPSKEVYVLVMDELYFRTNKDVLYFKTKSYHKFGTPLFKEDDHYFSGR